MKKLILLSLLIFLIKPASAQTPATIKGRIIGQSMEELADVRVINIHSLDTIRSDTRGFFSIKASYGDTLIFIHSKYSKVIRPIWNTRNRINLIMINRKTAMLPDSGSEYREAARDDEKLYKILEKGAERSGIWNY